MNMISFLVYMSFLKCILFVFYCHRHTISYFRFDTDGHGRKYKKQAEILNFFNGQIMLLQVFFYPICLIHDRDPLMIPSFF